MSGDSQKLLELAERCEKAEGPDRELDADVAVAVDARPDWLRSDTRSLVNAARGHVSAGTYGPGFEALEYTASLDAALMLVPPVKGGVAYWEAHADGAAIVRTGVDAEDDHCAFARSPALALCAAALRARAAI